MGRRKIGWFRGAYKLAALADQIRTAHQVCEEHGRVIRLLLQNQIIAARDSGAALLLAKATLIRLRKAAKHSRGERVPGFMEWVRQKTWLSHSTANNYMLIAKNWDRLRTEVEGGDLSIKRALEILQQGREEEEQTATSEEPASKGPSEYDFALEALKDEFANVVGRWSSRMVIALANHGFFFHQLCEIGKKMQLKWAEEAA
jgi:hypothetical protein